MLQKDIPPLVGSVRLTFSWRGTLIADLRQLIEDVQLIAAKKRSSEVPARIAAFFLFNCNYNSCLYRNMDRSFL